MNVKMYPYANGRVELELRPEDENGTERTLLKLLSERRLCAQMESFSGNFLRITAKPLPKPRAKKRGR